jgi:hypothetical protein
MLLDELLLVADVCLEVLLQLLANGLLRCGLQQAGAATHTANGRYSNVRIC